MKNQLFRNAGLHTLINVGGSLLPFGLALFLSLMFDKNPINRLSITGKGELVLMCIPLCITVLFTLYHYKKEVGINKLSHISYALNVIVIIVAVSVYSFSIKGLNANIDSNGNPILNTKLLYFSYFILFWTILMVFIAKFIEDGVNKELVESRKEDASSLEKKFKKNNPET